MYSQKTQVRPSALQPRSDLNNFAPLEAKNGAALIDHIYMDAMGFGMGCCCLQVTFQCCNIDQARRMYDALIPIGPIMARVFIACALFLSFLIPFIAGLDGCKPTLEGLHRRCGLPVERNCWERGRSYRGGARPQGKGLVVTSSAVKAYALGV